MGRSLVEESLRDMKHNWRYALESLRDFACALAVFAVFFAVLEADRTYFFPPPMLTLISNGVTADGVPALRGWGEIGNPLAQVVHTTSLATAPVVVGLLAVAFSAIVTLNLAIVRHLRRVHASSRRGAWREG
jgi:hypothetical protein